MEPEEARALRDREPSQEDEDDERQVEEENEVGEEALEHGRVILVPFQRFESKMPFSEGIPWWTAALLLRVSDEAIGSRVTCKVIVVLDRRPNPQLREQIDSFRKREP